MIKKIYIILANHYNQSDKTKEIKKKIFSLKKKIAFRDAHNIKATRIPQTRQFKSYKQNKYMHKI